MSAQFLISQMPQRSPEIGEVLKARRAAVTALGVLGKSKTAKVKTLKAEYSYEYLDLPTLIHTTQGALEEADLEALWFTAKDDGGRDVMVNELIHVESGQFIRSYLPMVYDQSKGMQGVGGASTMARRYVYLDNLGLSPVDKDGVETLKPEVHPLDAIADREKNRSHEELITEAIERLEQQPTQPVIAFARRKLEWLEKLSKDYRDSRVLTNKESIEGAIQDAEQALAANSHGSNDAGPGNQTTEGTA